MALLLDRLSALTLGLESFIYISIYIVYINICVTCDIYGVYISRAI